MLPDRLGLNVLLMMTVMACALSVVTSQHKARKLYLELQKQKDYAQQMDVERGQLQLELSTWATPARVEKIAALQLQMQLPRHEQVRYIRIKQSSSSTPDVSANNTDATASGDVASPYPESATSKISATGGVQEAGDNHSIRFSTTGLADKNPVGEARVALKAKPNEHSFPLAEKGANSSEGVNR